MNDSRDQDNLDAGEIARHRLAAPSPALKTRVLRAAHDAWAETHPVLPEVSWRYPAFRLAASLAIAMGLVCFANIADKHSMARWKAFKQAPVTSRPLTVSPNDAWSPGFAAAASLLPPRNAAENLLRHVRQFQEMLGTASGLNE